MRKQYREYVYKENVKNIRLRKKILLLTTGIVLVSGTMLLKNKKNNTSYSSVTYKPFVEGSNVIVSNGNSDSTIEIDNNFKYDDEVIEINSVSSDREEDNIDVIPKVIGGDSIVSVSDVNMRLNTNTNSYKMGFIPKGETVDRILSFGNFDLVRYNNKISFISSDYTRESSIDYNNEYYNVEEYHDILYTTSKVHFRLGPSTSEYDLGMLDKNEELIAIGKASLYNDPNDIWYIVRVRGQIGFVKGSYTKSTKSELLKMDNTMDNIIVKKLGYLKEDSALFDNYNNVISYCDKYQLVEVLDSVGNKYLVNIDGSVGFVNKSSVNNMENKFIVVDISSQRIYIYSNNDIILRGRCTTGKKSSPTELGYFSPYGKSDSHVFPDGTHEAVILWEPFNGGQGLHDASWEKDKYFGNTEYQMKHGSAGCVRLPDDVAYFVKENTSMSNKVLVKK